MTTSELPFLAGEPAPPALNDTLRAAILARVVGNRVKGYPTGYPVRYGSSCWYCSHPWRVSRKGAAHHDESDPAEQAERATQRAYRQRLRQRAPVPAPAVA